MAQLLDQSLGVLVEQSINLDFEFDLVTKSSDYYQSTAGDVPRSLLAQPEQLHVARQPQRARQRELDEPISCATS